MNTSALASKADRSLVVSSHQIETDGFLSTVEPHEIGALALGQPVVVTGEVSLRTLNLDDACAGIGEPAAAHRGSDGLLQ